MGAFYGGERKESSKKKMILGIGSDLEEVMRIEALIRNYGDRFLERLFTPRERTKANASSSQAATLAKRFAAKEAFVKALGIGFSQGLTWHEIEVINDDKGKPALCVHGKAKEALNALGQGKKTRLHLSLSDTKNHAFAIVVIEQEEA